MADEVKETISNFNLKDGLSIDEAKVSALILCLVICFIFVLVKVKEIPAKRVSHLYHLQNP